MALQTATFPVIRDAFLLTTFGNKGWLGSNDFDVEGTFVWATGPEAGTVFWTGGPGGSAPAGAYVNWSFSNPNNQGLGMPGSAGENAVEMYGAAQTQSPGMWNDIGELDSQGYCIEYGGAVIPLPAGAWVGLALFGCIAASTVRRKLRRA